MNGPKGGFRADSDDELSRQKAEVEIPRAIVIRSAGVGGCAVCNSKVAGEVVGKC